MTDTLLMMLRDRLSAASNSIACVAPGYENLDYSSLVRIVEDTILKLENLGLRENDPVFFIADREPATAILTLAILSHTIAVPLNPDYRHREVSSLLTQVPVKAFLVNTVQRNAIHGLIENLNIPVIEFKWDGWSVQFNSTPDPIINDATNSEIELSKETALILQTSGSTAEPRIVPLSHENLLASTNNVIRSLSLTSEDKCLHMLPMYHIGGIVDVLMAPLLSGGQVIFNKGLDTQGFFHLNAEYAPTWTQTVPAMLQELITIAERNPAEIPQNNLRLIRSVSAPLPDALYHAAIKVFDTSIVEIYGMTESSGVITSNPVQQEQQKIGSTGVSAGPELRIVAEDGEVLEPHQVGEILIQGKSIMRGYLSKTRPAEDNIEIHDAWFNTGDLGYLDEDGFLFITGRLKDIINRGGEKISPSEIDKIALLHPMVMDAASFAIPHTDLGEDIIMVAVIEPGSKVQEEQIRDFMRDKLAYFKIPRHIILVDNIPRQNGKLQRRILSEQYSNTMENRDHLTSSNLSPQEYVSKALAGLWERVLEIDRIGMDDDFFYMGGNSLLATVMVNQMQETWGVPVFVSAIYDAPVFRDFEQHLKDNYPQLLERIAEKGV